MERVKIRGSKTSATPTSTSLITSDSTTMATTNPHSSGKSDQKHLCERRDRLNRKSPQPIVHPDFAHAQTEENSVFRFSEDSRPMFSPIPMNSSDGEDSPRPASSRGSSKEKTAFPAIHVEKCEKDTLPSLCSNSFNPDSPARLNSPAESDPDVDNEVMSTSQSSGGLSVPSPYLHRKSDGRVVLMTQDSNSRGMLTSWSRSEGNLPEAVRRSHSTPSSHSQLLDIRYRPDWQARPTLRQHSDNALHEMRRRDEREVQGRASPACPRRLTARLEPLSLGPGQRTLSASNLQDH